MSGPGVISCALASVLWVTCFAVGVQRGALPWALALAAGGVVAWLLVTAPAVVNRLRFGGRDLLWGVAVGGASLAATYGLYPFARSLLPWLATDVRTLYQILPTAPAMVPLVLLVVVAEELLWRGALVRALRVDHPPAIAVVLASALYASAQLGLGVPVLGAVAFLFGVVWAVLGLRTRGLVAPLVAHAMWTVTVFALVPLEAHPLLGAP